MFTTMPAPVTTTGTGPAVTTVITSVVITNPVTTVLSTNTSVVITQTTGESTPAIPSYLLWAVIAVGAVLIIAVIVLIVRTRRIP
jgi:glucan phosphoethanolaminetransferase (alkaline phosphatase superfamily)